MGPEEIPPRLYKGAGAYGFCPVRGTAQSTLSQLKGCGRLPLLARPART